MNKNKILRLILSIMLFFCPLSSKGFAVNIPGYVDLDEVKFEISPLHERFGEFGDYFYGNIPKEEDKEYQIVIINEIFQTEKIDGITSAWVKVEIISGTDRDGNVLKNGTTGWCFGGYLE